MRSLILAAALAFAAIPARADGYGPPQVPPQDRLIETTLGLHYAPAENLERIDVDLLDHAERSIDMAAFVLTDYPVIEALGRAAQRGVVVRVLLDRSQHDERPEVPPLAHLRELPNVAIRIKLRRVYMHLKSYAIDGRVLRTGSANFSASGLKQQDNDLIAIASPAAAARFSSDFAQAFADGRPE